jgi:bifunctional non-homologous end joining protein LigD
MLAVAGGLPDEAKSADDWRFEFKWDGIRALVHVEDGGARVVTRNGQDRTSTFPELEALGGALGGHRAILDGEIVALRSGEVADFQRLQSRINVVDTRRAVELSRTVPIRYFTFDLLFLDAVSTMTESYVERRALLDGLGLDGDHWAVPSSFVGPGSDILDVARTLGVEGVVAKKATGRYRPGRRSPEWVKVKLMRTQEVVIGGWTQGQGARSGTLGALLVGIPGEEGLIYAGKVGTGFNAHSLEDLGRRFATLERPSSPFTGAVPAAAMTGTVWVEPCLVGEVRFSEWTKTGLLRQPSWRGLRPDKEPEEVVREDPLA